MIFDNGGSHKHVYPLTRATGNTVSAKMAEHLSIFPKTERIRMDNATHFKNEKVLSLLQDNGNPPIWSVPYKSQILEQPKSGV